MMFEKHFCSARFITATNKDHLNDVIPYMFSKLKYPSEDIEIGLRQREK